MFLNLVYAKLIFFKRFNKNTNEMPEDGPEVLKNK